MSMCLALATATACSIFRSLAQSSCVYLPRCLMTRLMGHRKQVRDRLGGISRLASEQPTHGVMTVDGRTRHYSPTSNPLTHPLAGGLW
ncbi:hypothetical protein BZA05DRAFT_125388 [Tricharina praecox]|uniref:uncharacterized protein n=1 Tax=Tricharina praecox TaxID=43433 RepID=UPI00221E5108|nr:uncharacterized protein BZA05DRAFT_125388 [Tricharina praecox]KAI5847535.1 hypothetical protein BZA05DRAFT_125388 [Tricharina praecox]